MQTLLGKTESKILSFLLGGGLLPNGDLHVNSASPVLAEGETYLLFLKDGPYYVTPLVHGLVLRELDYNGQQLYADEEGNLVDFGDKAVRRGPKLFSSTRKRLADKLGWAFEEAEPAGGNVAALGRPDTGSDVSPPRANTVKQPLSEFRSRPAILSQVSKLASERASLRSRSAFRRRPELAPAFAARDTAPAFTPAKPTPDNKP